MPYINVKTNLSVDAKQEESIKEFLGEKIGILPGKTENWLMVDIQGNQTLYFQGNKTPAAYVEVALYGKANSTIYNQMTAAITQLLVQELSMDASRIYVRYEEVANWGWNGSNF